MRKIIITILLTFFSVIGSPSFLFAATNNDSVNVNLDVNYCNNNNICESLEDFSSCPSDCSATCNNNNMCEVGLGENTTNCPSDCVIVPPAPVVNGGSRAIGSLIINNYFENLNVEVGYNNATIKWNSPVSTMSTVRWGTTSDYRDGVVRNVNFTSDHKIEINNLNDGTTYYFKIQSTDLLGRSSYLDSQYFKTLSLPDNIPPGNPTNVRAQSNNSGVVIFWTNSQDKDFDYVRVIKTTDRFYSNPLSGVLVYEGKGNYFTDSKVKNNTKYFYSLFSRDTSGNYSSGSLVSIIHNPLKQPDAAQNQDDDEIKIETPQISTDVYTVYQKLSSFNFNLGTILDLDGNLPSKIKTNHKSEGKNDDIWVEIKNADREIIDQFFFSRTRDKDGFLSVDIPSFKHNGYYSIVIYGYNRNGYISIINQGAFNISNITTQEIQTSSQNTTFVIIFWIFISVFVIILIIYIIRKLLVRYS